MADIFISYDSKDRPTMRRLAEALEARGWSVWWDHRNLRAGQHFDRIIEEEISKARAVIVIWSQNSCTDSVRSTRHSNTARSKRNREWMSTTT